MGQRVIACQVVNEYVQGDGVVVGAVGSHNEVLIELDFSSADSVWDGTTKTVTFTDAMGQNPVNILLTTNLLADGQDKVYLVPVPQAAKTVAGMMGMSVSGVVTENGNEVLRASTELAKFRVLPSETARWTGETDIPASVADQIQAEMDAIIPDITMIAAALDNIDIETLPDDLDRFYLHTQNSAIHVTPEKKTYWDGKQDALTYDQTPTQGSQNALTSGAVYQSIQQNTAVDEVLSGSSAHPVQNKAIYTALQNIYTSLDGKQPKVSGKGLSTNDYTTAEKNKLAGIEAQANKYTHPAYTARTGKPTANLTPGFGGTVTVSQITSDAKGHVTGATDRTIKIPSTAASPSAAGLMSAADKTKLNGIAAGAQVNSITGVKGNAEGSYRTGNVNLTPANLGAAPASHTHTTDAVTDLVTATKYGPTGLVSFQDAHGGLPLKSCIVSIEPTQSGSGNPTPANVRPISGRENVKVWRFEKNFFPQADVTFEVHEGNKTVNFPHPLPAGTYTFSADLTSTYNGNCLVHIIRGDGTSIPFSLTPGTRVSASFTAAGGNEIKGVRFYIGDGYNTSYNNSGAWSNIQVETGSTATAYEDSETVVDADLPETVYSGTLDVLTGKLTVTHGYIKPTEYTGSDLSDTTVVVFTRIPLGKHGLSYNIVSNVATGAAATDANIARYGYVTRQSIVGTSPLLFIAASTTAHPTMASLSQALLDADACFAYELETPEVYQLTPSQVASLIGQNHIWADTGNITVEYGAFLQALEGAVENHTHALPGLPGILPVTKGGTGNSAGYVTAGQKSGTTLGEKATAEGNDTTASDSYAHAEGNGTTASNVGCHAEGFGTTASGMWAHAEGDRSKASGNYSHAEGYDTTASNGTSHAEGNETTASGPSSHAEGNHTTASGTCSHAEGDHTTASMDCQHVFGKMNVPDNHCVEVVGWGTNSTQKNIRTLDTSGNMTIAGTLTQSSDARLKDIQGEVPDVSGIRAVRFRWNDTNGEHDDRDHIGYLAQEVEKIAPFLVGDDSNGYKSLDYIALLCAKVEMLERRVAELEGGR